MRGTGDVLRLLRKANPGWTIQEHAIRTAIRDGHMDPPANLIGRYYVWTDDEIRKLADVLKCKMPDLGPEGDG